MLLKLRGRLFPLLFPTFIFCFYFLITKLPHCFQFVFCFERFAQETKKKVVVFNVQILKNRKHIENKVTVL